MRTKVLHISLHNKKSSHSGGLRHRDQEKRTNKFRHRICGKISFTIYMLYSNESLYVHQFFNGNYERKVCIGHQTSGGNKLGDILAIHLYNQITNATVPSKIKMIDFKYYTYVHVKNKIRLNIYSIGNGVGSKIFSLKYNRWKLLKVTSFFFFFLRKSFVLNFIINKCFMTLIYNRWLYCLYMQTQLWRKLNVEGIRLCDCGPKLFSFGRKFLQEPNQTL